MEPPAPNMLNGRQVGRWQQMEEGQLHADEHDHV